MNVIDVPRRQIREPGARHARMGLEARHERLRNFELAFRRGVAGHDELEAQDPARIETGVDARELQEAARRAGRRR